MHRDCGQASPPPGIKIVRTVANVIASCLPSQTTYAYDHLVEGGGRDGAADGASLLRRISWDKKIMYKTQDLFLPDHHHNHLLSAQQEDSLLPIKLNSFHCLYSRPNRSTQPTRLLKLLRKTSSTLSHPVNRYFYHQHAFLQDHHPFLPCRCDCRLCLRRRLLARARPLRT